MAQRVVIELELPGDRDALRFPAAVHARLQELLDRQDQGVGLTEAEQREAEGLVNLAETLSLLQRRIERALRQGNNGVQ